MKIQDVNDTDVVTIGPDVPFADVVDCLLNHGISGLPVVDEKGRLLGIVTEADLVSKEAYARGGGLSGCSPTTSEAVIRSGYASLPVSRRVSS